MAIPRTVAFSNALSGLNDISQGTCTMKYNPRINEELAAHPGIASLHPWQDVDTAQGILEIYYKFEEILKEISGMDKFSLHPQGGAHAVYTAASIMRAYHRDRGELDKRREIISSAFTHPCDHAAPATAGFRLIILPPSENGYPSVEAVKAASDKVLTHRGRLKENVAVVTEGACITNLCDLL